MVLYDEISIKLRDERFFDLLFERATEGDREISHIEEILTDPLVSLSQALDAFPLQESCAARNIQRTRRLATALIDPEGKVDLPLVEDVAELLADHFYSIGPGRYLDAQRNAHLYRVLNWLTDETLRHRLESLDVDPTNLHAVQLIRETLHLPLGTDVDRAVTRRAVLAAWMTYLRQNVGSCFATAPAILIQTEQPDRFLDDMADLLTVGRLRRTIRGVTHTVPLSFSWGQGDLLKLIPLIGGVEPLAAAPGFQRAFAAAGFADTPAQVKKLLKQAADPTVWFTRPDTLIRSVISQQTTSFESAYRVATAAFKGVADNALLKAWEFSLASFSHVASDISQWNFFSSLGIESNEPGGIGAAMTAYLQERIDQINRELQHFQGDHDILLGAVRGLESRIRHASESEAGWIRTDYNAKLVELRGIERQVEDAQWRGNRLGALYKMMSERYLELFPDYFQEVYDPEMHDIGPSPYDDSPAGFRLLYKHGRDNTSLWEAIRDEDQFIRSLSNFFIITEGLLTDEEELKEEVSGLVTAIITHIRTPLFLQTALQRMGRTHKKGSKPWAYLSGGTMTSLVARYYGRESEPTLKSRIPENTTDLALFFLETLKELPPEVLSPFEDDPTRSLLIQSPTHGFLLKPGYPKFRQGWLYRGNTYTWLRDNVIRPGQGLIETTMLDSEMIKALLKVCESRLPRPLRSLFRKGSNGLSKNRLNLREFRHALVDRLMALGWEQRGMQFLSPGQIDSLLFSLAPFVPIHLFRQRIEEVFSYLPVETTLVMQAFDQTHPRVTDRAPLSALEFQQKAQALFLATTGEVSSPNDRTWQIREAMRRVGIALPEPFFVADTNWSRDAFAFVVNPGTGDLDFWRSDYIGLEGAPMEGWHHHWNKTSKTPWSIYIDPSNYS